MMIHKMIENAFKQHTHTYVHSCRFVFIITSSMPYHTHISLCMILKMHCSALKKHDVKCVSCRGSL